MPNKSHQARRLLKIAVLGDTNVGKICLARTYSTGKFEDNLNPKNHWDFFFKQLKVMELNIELKIVVLAGHKMWRGLLSAAVENAHGILLLYDTANVNTFKTLGDRCETLRKSAPEAIKFIIGARADLSHQREVDFNEGQNFAKEENLEFFECSAKTGENVNEIFEQMALRILQKQKLIPLNPLDKTETEEKSLECKQIEHILNATCLTEEEILKGSCTETDIFNHKLKDSNYPEDSNSLSTVEVANVIAIKGDKVCS